MNSETTIGPTRSETARIIAVTMGDPAGIGPEICAKFISQSELPSSTIPLILGDAAALNHYLSSLNLTSNYQTISFDAFQSTGLERITAPTVVDFGGFRFSELKLGAATATGGAAAYRYVDQAIQWNLEGLVSAVVTGPINKTALQSAGYNFPGHTEIFAQRTETADFCMMQYSDELTCSFVTTHIGYADVVPQLTTSRILDVIQLTDAALNRINGCRPKLIVCGLNPHAGEEGLFGDREEERIIIPAVKQAIAAGIDIAGPFPPDTCFIPRCRKQTDGYICLYHDQGHIPLKALAFDQAVNVTLGLPLIRTSVDHGTAFDIVGKNIAKETSLLAAYRLAERLIDSNSPDNK